MEFWKKFLKERTVNVYIGLGIAVLSAIASLVYAFGFCANNPQFFNVVPVVLPLVGLVAYVALVMFKPTARYAAAAMWVCTLAAFMVYLATSYMHLADCFYGGVNSETIKLMDGGFVACLVIFLVTTVAGNVIMWRKMVRDDIQEVNENE